MPEKFEIYASEDEREQKAFGVCCGEFLEQKLLIN